MYLPNFEYFAPASLEEALHLLYRHREALRPLAGGTDLLISMKNREQVPWGLMSLRRIPELHRMEADSEWVEVGAAVTVTELEESGLVSRNSAFLDLFEGMASPQVRNRATIGGNLCTAAACADFPPVLLINEATVRLRSVEGEREMRLSQFLVGPRQTARTPVELLVSVRFRRANRGSAYVKFGVREAVNIAIVGVAGALHPGGDSSCRVCLASTAASPVPVLFEKELRTDCSPAEARNQWQQIAEEFSHQHQPISDVRGSAEYRLHLIQTGVVRALKRARRRLRG
jgi:carbon-monoxide dehydrogenase medium subunit